MTREKEIEQAADEHFAHSWKGSVKDAFAEGAQWADEHPKDNLGINFPKYDNIVDKVFGAGNLECWEYDQAKQLVKLAKDELLLELKAQQNNIVEQLTAFAQHLNKRGAFRDDLCMDFEHEAQSFIESMKENKP